MAYNLAQFLSRLYIKCNMYLKYILDIFREFNGYHVVRRWHRKACLSRFVLVCTQLTFDLIMWPRGSFRLGIYPISVYLPISGHKTHGWQLLLNFAIRSCVFMIWSRIRMILQHLGLWLIKPANGMWIIPPFRKSRLLYLLFSTMKRLLITFVNS